MWLFICSQESLGGNSRTGMLATVSPCSWHQDETAATLRYATQARSIVNTVRINESPQNKIIRRLRAEIERLKGSVENERGGPSSVALSPRGDENAALKDEIDGLRASVDRLEGELAESRRAEAELEETRSLMINRESAELTRAREERDDMKKKFEEFIVEHKKCLDLCTEKQSAIESLERAVRVANDEKTELRTKLELTENRVDEMTEVVRNLAVEKSGLADRLREMEKAVSEWKNDAEETEALLKARVERAEREAAELREEADYHRNSEKEIESLKSDMKNESEKLQEALDREMKLKQRFNECFSDLESVRDELAAVTGRLHSCQNNLKMREDESKRWSEKHASLEKQLAPNSAQLEPTQLILKDIESTNRPPKISVSVQTRYSLKIIYQLHFVTFLSIIFLYFQHITNVGFSRIVN